MALDALSQSVADYFEEVALDIFSGDPASNPNLSVEVTGAEMAGDTPVLLLITPWTTVGMAFPPDERLPETLRIDHRSYPVISNEIPELGRYHSVLLLPDVSGFADQESLREAASALLPGLRAAIEKARDELTNVDDPGRRSLITNLGKTETRAARESAFGDPGHLSARE